MAHRLSPEAEFELHGIWDYIAGESHNPNIADLFIDTLTDTFLLLSVSPYIGRRLDDDLRPGLRSFPVRNYIIVYRIGLDDDVQILHVVHGSRDIQALFGQ